MELITDGDDDVVLKQGEREEKEVEPEESFIDWGNLLGHQQRIICGSRSGLATATVGGGESRTQ